LANTLGGYLQSVDEIPRTGLLNDYCRALAQVTLSLLDRDSDGSLIVDYLGPGFRKHIAKSLKDEDFRAALQIMTSQLEHWRSVGDEKLSGRYSALGAYFATYGFR
jgi:hypothetical protein